MNDKIMNYDKLLECIDEYISKARGSINAIENASHNLNSENDFQDQEHELYTLELEYFLKHIYTSLCVLLESLGLTMTLEQLKQEFNKNRKDLTKLNMIPYVGELNSVVLDVLRPYYLSLSELLGVKVDNTKDDGKRLEKILWNTSKVVKDRNIEPKDEAQVRKCVYELLIHFFPDTIREIPICQVTKTYKPDIGVRSLKTAIEYKFADSESEVKTAIGGFYEDMRGYSGSEDWKKFYAVVYMTDAFVTLEQIKAEFKHTSADENWKPILVQGKGGRTKKA